ncbi:MAG: hypothetical protein IKE22_11910 [Atopobiaceae bacterium]|nr:hypothetical protein [Atopobiaceae bacterium]
MMNNQNNDLLSPRQNALVQCFPGQSYIAAVCDAIMSATSIVWILTMLLGVIACYAGLRAGAIAVLNAWLIWPLGGLVCGMVALYLRDRR